jgi:hypothetical protein
VKRGRDSRAAAAAHGAEAKNALVLSTHTNFT